MKAIFAEGRKRTRGTNSRKLLLAVKAMMACQRFTIKQLEHYSGQAHGALWSYVKLLHELKMLHIFGLANTKGRRAIVYQWGPGEDADVRALTKEEQRDRKRRAANRQRTRPGYTHLVGGTLGSDQPASSLRDDC